MYYAPINHLPPSGHRWGYGWGFDHHAINDPAFGAKSEFKCRQIPRLVDIGYVFII